MDQSKRDLRSSSLKKRAADPTEVIRPSLLSYKKYVVPWSLRSIAEKKPSSNLKYFLFKIWIRISFQAPEPKKQKLSPSIADLPLEVCITKFHIKYHKEITQKSWMRVEGVRQRFMILFWIIRMTLQWLYIWFKGICLRFRLLMQYSKRFRHLTS